MYCVFSALWKGLLKFLSYVILNLKFSLQAHLFCGFSLNKFERNDLTKRSTLSRNWINFHFEESLAVVQKIYP